MNGSSSDSFIMNGCKRGGFIMNETVIVVVL